MMFKETCTSLSLKSTFYNLLYKVWPIPIKDHQIWDWIPDQLKYPTHNFTVSILSLEWDHRQVYSISMVGPQTRMSMVPTVTAYCAMLADAMCHMFTLDDNNTHIRCDLVHILFALRCDLVSAVTWERVWRGLRRGFEMEDKWWAAAPHVRASISGLQLPW